MVKIFGWGIVLAIASFIITTCTAPFIVAKQGEGSLLFLFGFGFSFLLGVISVIGLFITLVLERIKDKKEEEDDLSKY